MNATEKAMLQLLRRALFQEENILPKRVDWESVYKESNEQAVSMLLYDCLTDDEKLSLSHELQQRWQQSVMKYVYANENLLREQETVLSLLEQNSISCAILKGSSVSMHYPKPHLRNMGDIDLLVDAEQMKAAVQILQNNGYGDIWEEEHHCHLTVSKNGITVEVHKEPNGIFMCKNLSLAQRMHDYFRDAVEKRVFADGLPILPEVQETIVLILHKLEHFMGKGLGLRQLCDWSMFVDRQMTKEVWDEVIPLLQEFKLWHFTEIMTGVCVEYLGLPAQGRILEMEYDSEVIADVMERILKSGNFGIKEMSYGERYFMDMSSPNRIASFFKVLAGVCKQHWPICEKYPGLMIVAPAVIWFKYLGLLFKGDKPKFRPIKMYRSAGEKQKLYAELQSFVTENADNRLDEGAENIEIGLELISLIRDVLHHTDEFAYMAQGMIDKIPRIVEYAKGQGLYLFLCEHSTLRDYLQKEELVKSAMPSVYLCTKQMEELKNLLSEFEKNQIHCMLLKGSRSREFYPKAELRSMGDIDLLYQPQQTKKVQHLLLGMGYHSNGNTTKHDYYQKGMLSVEMHKALCTPERQENFYFESIWDRAQQKKGYQYVCVMTPEDHYLYTFTHLAEHFQSGGIGIRMVLDIYMLSHMEGLDWSYINQILDKMGYTQFHESIHKLSDKWFALERNFAKQEEMQELENYVMHGGVFGSWENDNLNVSLRYGNRNRFLRDVMFPNYQTMQTVYPWLKTPVLLPVTWVMRGFGVLFFRRGSLKEQVERAQSFANDKKLVEERREFFEKYGLYGNKYNNQH